MKKNYKKLAIVIAVMILTLSIASTGFAANLKKSMAVTYRNIRVISNGVQAYFANEPFIVDEQGRTYLAVNDMATLFDKNITWDNATSTISINDKPGQNTQELYNQILTQQQTISQLESKLKNLEEKEEESISLKDLAKDLLKEYDEINKYLEVVDLKLKGDEDDIDVEVYLDLEDDDDLWADWDDLTDSKIESFLQDIVDEILDIEEYEDADIIGFIEDEDSGDVLAEFELDKKDNVVIDRIY